MGSGRFGKRVSSGVQVAVLYVYGMRQQERGSLLPAGRWRYSRVQYSAIEGVYVVCTRIGHSGVLGVLGKEGGNRVVLND